MIQASVDLSGLRDLHLPVKPPVFPLAYGWWVLLVLVLFILVAGFVSYHLWQRRPSVYAKHELQKILKISDDKVFLKEVSVLLRRVAIKSYGRQKIAPLSDKKWQTFLMDAAPHTFTEDMAYQIAFSPYEAHLKGKVNRSKLVDQAGNWINKVLKQKKSLDISRKKV